MTLQPPELDDPYERFWAEARDFSGGQLTPQEAQQAQALAKAPVNTSAHIAAVLAGAFLLHRAYVQRQLRERAPKDPTVAKIRMVLQLSGDIFTPFWGQIILGALMASYAQGLQEAKAPKSLPQEYLYSVANDYANRIQGHISEVSAEAMLHGYQALVNRNVDPKKALEKVISAYGVPLRTMNALVAVWSGDEEKKLHARAVLSGKSKRERELIEKAIKLRARTFGENEAWTGKTQAKQLVWMYGVEKGELPAHATRVWITARDEKVCPVCGPLHKKEVPVNEQFKTEIGKLWSPPVHPNCRCDIVLNVHESIDWDRASKDLFESESVAKAYGRDPYNRDTHGRFAHRESRSAKPYKEVRPVDPNVARILREAQEMYGVKPAREVTREAKEKAEEWIPEAPWRPQAVKIGGWKPSEAPLIGGAKITPLTPEQATKIQSGTKITSGVKINRQEQEAVKIRLRDKMAEGVRIALSKPAKDWAGGLHPNYFKLDQPLWAFKTPDQINEAEVGASQIVKIGRSEPVYSKKEMAEEAVNKYWEDVINDFLFNLPSEEGEYQQEEFLMTDVVHPKWGGTIELRIPRNDMEIAYMASAMDDTAQLRDTAEVSFMDYDGQPRLYSIQYQDIANYFGMHSDAEQNMPTLVRMDWGFHGETEINTTKHADDNRNPGSWHIQHHSTSGEGNAFKTIEVLPEKLN